MNKCQVMNCQNSKYAKGNCRLHYDKARRQARKAKVLAYLGGACAVCGQRSNLQIDHITPETKSYNVTEKLLIGFDKLVTELEKCQLLCSTHHWDKTRIDRGLKSLVCGTVNMYVNGKCRCKSCRKAWTNYYSPIKKQRRLEMVSK